MALSGVSKSFYSMGFNEYCNQIDLLMMGRGIVIRRNVWLGPQEGTQIENKY